MRRRKEIAYCQRSGAHFEYFDMFERIFYLKEYRDKLDERLGLKKRKK